MNLSNLSDSELDNFYAAANKKTKARATLTQGALEMSAAEEEISSRNQWSFISSMRGIERFPKHAAIIGHSQVDAARESVKENAQAVAGGVGDIVGRLTGPVVPFLVAAAALMLVWKLKK